MATPMSIALLLAFLQGLRLAYYAARRADADLSDEWRIDTVTQARLARL